MLEPWQPHLNFVLDKFSLRLTKNLKKFSIGVLKAYHQCCRALSFEYGILNIMQSKMLCRITCFCLLSLIINKLNADNFSITSLSLLYGNSYKVPIFPDKPDKKRFVVTVETLNERDWGDSYGFIDFVHAINQSNANIVYGEFIPRFNLPKSLQPAHEGLFKNFLLAPSIEMGASSNGISQTNYLLGLGTNLSLPYFKVFQLNAFRRVNQLYKDNWQITPVWFAPFSIGKFDFIFQGFLDFTTATQQVPTSLHTQPQFMVDVGKMAFHKKQILYVGTEVKIWRNKFFIRGINESVVQALVMLRF